MLLSWHVWVIIGILLFITEIFTTSFFFACFAIGAFAAALLSFCGAGVHVQILVFALASLICAFTVRPFVLRFLMKKGSPLKTGVDAMQGKIGHVIEPFGGPGSFGYVRINGEDWRAAGIYEEHFNQGESVIVDSIKGATLVIRKRDLSETA